MATLPPQLKTLGRDVLTIVALTFVSGLHASLAMPGKLGTIEHASMSRLLTLVLLTLGFMVIACSSPTIRWRRLLIVGSITWIIDTVINVLLLNTSGRDWLQNSFHLAITILVAGGFSYLFQSFSSSRPSREVMSSQ